MLYNSAQDYLNAEEKSIALFGMSGLGKTVLSEILRHQGHWFHYSIDYRIGSRYMNEAIEDNLKAEAMGSPLLRELLCSDSIEINSKLEIGNLDPLSTYLGKPGDPQKGGLPFEIYQERQNQHRMAEIKAMSDVAQFRARAKALYGYRDFIADCSGSLCEIVGHVDEIETSPLMQTLASVTLPVWIKGPENHSEFLVERFKKEPKPMYYQPEFLSQKWQDYLEEKNVEAHAVDPDDFAVWGFKALLEDRLPRYQAMAKHWGITITYDEVTQIENPEDFNQLIASKL